MDFQLHFERSWQLFTRFLPSLLLVTAVMLLVSVFSLGILAPVATAGYMQSLLLTLREGRVPQVKDVFSQMRLFFPLLGFSILIGLLVFFGFAMLLLPGFIALVAVAFFCMYVLPLMTDEGAGLFEAIETSYKMAIEQPVSEHIAVVAVYLVLMSIGGSVVLGTLFTTPFAVFFVLSVYETKRVRKVPHME